MNASPWIINLKNLIKHYSANQLLQCMLDENTNINALIIAYSEDEKRKALFELLPMQKKKEVAKLLPDLKTPPDFVLETIYTSLKNKLENPKTRIFLDKFKK
jgi:flagellar motor switch protein FliG